jgi:5'(3')-deoxyribonucleotidase
MLKDFLSPKTERPVIVTDVDGILVKWQSGLPYFAQKYNLPLDHILEMMVDEKFIAPSKLFNCSEEFATKLLLKYNNSDFIRYLSAYEDALKVVNELKKTHDFVAVTALGNSVDAHLNRQFNLSALFPDAFKDIFVCDYNESKDSLLTQVMEKYGNRVICYIDDLGKHTDSAVAVFRQYNSKAKVFYMPRGERDYLPTELCETVKDWHQVKDTMMTEAAKDHDAYIQRLYDLLKEVETKSINPWKSPGFGDEFRRPETWWDYHQPKFPSVGTGIEYLKYQPTAMTNFKLSNI